MKQRRTFTTRRRRRPHAACLLAAAGLLVAHAGARAAGHFDVDDAGMLEAGQCQYEAWWGRIGADPAGVVHGGPACRVGPVELGLNLDRASAQGVHTVAAGPQLKWTFAGASADAPWSAALSIGASFDVRRGGRAGGQLVLPLTWRPADSLQLHANLGADWATGTGARTPRGGLAAEWALDEKFSLIAERNRATGLWTSRIGGRFSLTPRVSLDLSASRTGPQGVRGIVVGLNHAFALK